MLDDLISAVADYLDLRAKSNLRNMLWWLAAIAAVIGLCFLIAKIIPESPFR